MKKYLIFCLLGLIPLLGHGQTYYTAPVSDLETDFGGRLSAAADKKLAKGLHLTFDGEVRFKNDFSTLGRWQAGVGLTYKVNPYLKVGGGYEFIDKLNSSG
ncbi:MAG: DUF2490 domain-containing protein, partial [Bacteroidales bacterium]|nr:DUF2490 domain-containing protein [Bacteroidales bacterium]